MEEKRGPEKLEHSIFLIGFMGSGKSTVAKALQGITHAQIMEMDEVIAQQEGKSIPKIFEEDGEAYFRGLETALLAGLQEQAPCIVSCGGGVAMRQENVDIMKRNGKVVLLTASPKTILDRVKGNEDRPLLAGKKNVDAIGELMEQRKGRYEAAADIAVSTDGKKIEEIAWEILRAM